MIDPSHHRQETEHGQKASSSILPGAPDCVAGDCRHADVGLGRDWDFSRTKTDLDPGGTVTFSNQGGEFHTFTKVAAFGGGCIPFINQILHLDAVPECLPLAADNATPQAFIDSGLPPGLGLTLPVTLTKPGVDKFQCLIHPWMQTTVTVM